MKTFLKSKSRKVLSFSTALIMAVCLLIPAVEAFGAQSNADIDAAVATYAKLAEIVNPQVDSVYANIKSSVSEYAGQLVYGIIGNKENIKALAKPLVSGAIKSALLGYNISNAALDSLIDQTVEQAVDNAVVDQILDNEFVQAVLARTVRYATADIIESLHIDADKDAVALNLINHIWNASLKSVGNASTKVKSDLDIIAAAGTVVNVSYYSFDVVSWNTLLGIKTTPKEINVTGWNRNNINTYIIGSVGLNTASKYNEYRTALGQIDYTSVILNAARRAVIDEIRERVEALALRVKTEALSLLESKLAKIGVYVSLNPADSFEKIGRDILSALEAKAAQDTRDTLQSLIDRLLNC